MQSSRTLSTLKSAASLRITVNNYQIKSITIVYLDKQPFEE